MKIKKRVWGGWWTGATSPSLTRSHCYTLSNVGANRRGPQQSQEVLLLQRESHRKEVVPRERREQVVMHCSWDVGGCY